jgi:hypothetical protein
MIPILQRMARDRALRRRLERDMRIREARRRYEKFIVAEERRNERLQRLAVEAHLVGSHELRDKLAQIMLQNDAGIRLWKERMVYFEMMQEVMSQAQACANFAEGFHTMAQSIASAANPADLARIQADIQRSFVHADQLHEMTEQLVEAMDAELEQANAGDANSAADTAAVLEKIIRAAEGARAPDGAQPGVDRAIDDLLQEIVTTRG